MWKDDDDDEENDEDDEEKGQRELERWMAAASRQSGRSGAIGMRSIPIDNRIYGGKLAKEGDEIGDARVRGNSERWKPLRRGKPANSPSLSLSLSLSIFFSLAVAPSSSSSSSTLSAHHPFSLLLSCSFPFHSLIPISRFSGLSSVLFRRLNQLAEEIARRRG